MRRLAVGIALLVIAGLAVEGAVHGVTGRSLVRSEPARRGPPPIERPDEQLGLYRRHADPRVGYILEPSTTLTLLESTVTTDAYGMRQRARPELSDARRILVVGDSVAFGFGVNDDECLAHRLEVLLDDVAVRGDDGRRVMCFTVAVPSWNHASPRAFLEHHIERLAPDVVLYLPVHNDLVDTSGVSSRGTRREEPAVSSERPLVELTVGRSEHLARAAEDSAEVKGDELDDLGIDALLADVSATSRARYASAADSILAMSAMAAARDAHFAVLRTGASEFGALLDGHLARRGEDGVALVTSAIPLVRTMSRSFTLGYDAHPNPETLGVWAAWIGEALAERGWVDARDDVAWPSAPDDYTAARRTILTPSAALARADHERGLAREAALAEIDFITGRGIRQVLGGVNPNSIARTGVCAALREPAAGMDLLVVASPIASRPDLYPLDVEVRWRGETLGTFTLPRDALGRFRAPLPAPAGDAGLLGEVELLPADWVVARMDSRTLVASFRPLRLAVVER